MRAALLAPGGGANQSSGQRSSSGIASRSAAVARGRCFEPTDMPAAYHAQNAPGSAAGSILALQNARGSPSPAVLACADASCTPEGRAGSSKHEFPPVNWRTDALAVAGDDQERSIQLLRSTCSPRTRTEDSVGCRPGRRGLARRGSLTRGLSHPAQDSRYSAPG